MLQVKYVYLKILMYVANHILWKKAMKQKFENFIN